MKHKAKDDGNVIIFMGFWSKILDKLNFDLMMALDEKERIY